MNLKMPTSPTSRVLLGTAVAVVVGGAYYMFGAMDKGSDHPIEINATKGPMKSGFSGASKGPVEVNAKKPEIFGGRGEVPTPTPALTPDLVPDLVPEAKPDATPDVEQLVPQKKATIILEQVEKELKEVEELTK